MEAGGLVSEANWSSLDPAMMPVEESEMLTLLLGINEQDHEPNMGVPSVYWSDHSVDPYFSSENTNCIPYNWLQGDCSSTSASNVISTSTNDLHILDGNQGCYLDDDAIPAPMNFFIGDAQPSLPVILMNEDAPSNEARESMDSPPAPLLPSDHCSQAMKRRLHEADLGKAADDRNIGSSKKKSRIISAPVPKKGKNALFKRSQKRTVAVSNEAESNADANAQSSSSCSWEDESSALPETNGATTSSSSKGSGALILNGKTRADRGSATDPQSLYARKRRERTNERLQILQNLIPNGTKVDISTMLEEAVQYVKFLQIQIKLLSSDDMWKYAPIAYNGMNLGFDLNISQAVQLHKGVN